MSTSPRALLAPHRTAVAGLIVLSLAASAAALTQPYLTKLLIDDGLLARDFPRLLQVAAAIFTLGLLGTLLGGVNRYCYTRLSGRILFTLRERVYAHLQRLSPAFYARNRSGDILSRLDGDVAEIQRFALDSLFAAISGVFGLIGTVGFMLWLSPELSLLAAVLIPLQWLWLRHMRLRVRARTLGVRERAADISSFLVETLPAMKYIQAAAATAREHARLGQLNRGYLDTLLRLQLTEFATAAVPANLTGATRALVFVAGGWQVIEGELALGSLIAFGSYLGMAMGPVQSLLGVYMGYNRVRVSLDRVQELTDAVPEVDARGHLAPPAQGPVEIRLEAIGFRHAADEPAVLEAVDITLPPGARIGICGPSGSGKTTLVDLLLRHYDPHTGCIRVNGTDLRDFDLPAWRRRVALVAQDTVLFRGSLLDNLRYTRPDATEAEVLAALSSAQLAALLARLPQGLDTPVGERGARLSGGERQRLAIARALLQDPLLLIFDEATSAVDMSAERELMREVEHLFPNTTRIFVSHRETPLADADLLLEVRDGHVRQLVP